MRTIEINSEARNRSELADDLRSIANQIDEGYCSGIAYNGTDWAIDGDDEYDDEEEYDNEEEYYE